MAERVSNCHLVARRDPSEGIGCVGSGGVAEHHARLGGGIGVANRGDAGNDLSVAAVARRRCSGTDRSTPDVGAARIHRVGAAGRVIADRAGQGRRADVDAVG